MSSEKFCLRWNDFESNISSAFRDIRDEKDFFDVSIACEEDQLPAHKVILSACSPFFKRILSRNHSNSSQLVLYLKGVSFRDMESVLNFMYHGEVNVAQEDLNSFLQVAEDLRVKGLTQNNQESKRNIAPVKPPALSSRVSDISRTRAPSEVVSESVQPFPKRPRPVPPPPQPEPGDESDIEEVVTVVKAEPGSQSVGQMQPQEAEVETEQQEEEHTMAMYTTETEQYSEEYGDDYGADQGYTMDQGGYAMQGTIIGAGDQATGEDKIKCDFCNGWFHKRSMARHMERKHSMPVNVNCDLCTKVFGSHVNLKEHYRHEHGLSTRNKF